MRIVDRPNAPQVLQPLSFDDEWVITLVVVIGVAWSKFVALSFIGFFDGCGMFKNGLVLYIALDGE